MKSKKGICVVCRRYQRINPEHEVCPSCTPPEARMEEGQIITREALIYIEALESLWTSVEGLSIENLPEGEILSLQEALEVVNLAERDFLENGGYFTE